MTSIVAAEIVPVDSPEKAIEAADIVLCTANSLDPLFDGNWLRPGMAVSSISAGPDKTATAIWGVRREIDDTTVERASLIVVSLMQQVAWDEQHQLFDSSRTRGKVVELGDLLLGKVPGRRGDDEITLFANNTGTGNQFAAAGAIVYQKARAQGIGREIPTDWLMTSVKKWADLGFYPSP
jgi:alanine dehydrogenase